LGRKIGIGAVVGLIVLILLIVGAFWDGQALVDIFIILAAVTSLVAFALLGYAALQVIDLVKEVRGEVKTLVGSAQETMTEVQGTARFVSDNLVQPVSQAVGFVSAARATARSFTEPLYKRKSGS
jgi:predicted histidine transporter YuiF (NhaC family)